MSSLPSIIPYLSNSFSGETKRTLSSSPSQEAQYISQSSVVTIPPNIVRIHKEQDVIHSSSRLSLSQIDRSRVRYFVSESSQSQTSSSSTDRSDSATGSPTAPGSPARSPSFDSLTLSGISPPLLSSSLSSTDSPISRSLSSSLSSRSSTDSPISFRSASTSSTPTSRNSSTATLISSRSSSKSLTLRPDQLSRISCAISGTPSPSGRIIDTQEVMGEGEVLALKSSSVQLQIIATSSATPYRGQPTLPAITEGKSMLHPNSWISSSPLQSLYNSTTKRPGEFTPLDTWKMLLLAHTPLSQSALARLELETDFFTQLLAQPQLPLELFNNSNVEQLLIKADFFTILRPIVHEQVSLEAEAEVLPTICEQLKEIMDPEVQKAIGIELSAFVDEQINIYLAPLEKFDQNQLEMELGIKIANVLREQIEPGTYNPEETSQWDVHDVETKFSTQAATVQKLISTTVQKVVDPFQKKRSDAILQQLLNPANTQLRKEIVEALTRAAVDATIEAERTATTLSVAIPPNVGMIEIITHREQAGNTKAIFEAKGLNRYHAKTKPFRLYMELMKIQKIIDECQKIQYSRAYAEKHIKKHAQNTSERLIAKTVKLFSRTLKPFFKAAEFASVDLARMIIYLDNDGRVLPIDIFHYFREKITQEAKIQKISEEAMRIVIETILPMPKDVNMRITREHFDNHPTIIEARRLAKFIDSLSMRLRKKPNFSYLDLMTLSEEYMKEKAKRASMDEASALYDMIRQVLLDWATESLSPEDVKAYLLDHVSDETTEVYANMSAYKKKQAAFLISKAADMVSGILNGDQRLQLQTLGLLDGQMVEEQLMLGESPLKALPQPESTRT